MGTATLACALRTAWRRAVAGPVSRLRAAWRFALGAPDVAIPLLLHAAKADPGSFVAQMAAGRALAAAGGEPDAREAFRRACRISPRRFLRGPLPAALKEIVAVEVAGALMSAPREVASPDALVPAAPPARRADIRTAEEARRFQSLPPLDKTAAANVDWESVAARLASDASVDSADGA